MKKNILCIILSFFCLSSCALLSLKRSPSGELLDFTGSSGHKRRPSKNPDRIELAKEQSKRYKESELIMEDNEVHNYEIQNLLMYKEMAQLDQSLEKRTKEKRARMHKKSKSKMPIEKPSKPSVVNKNGEIDHILDDLRKLLSGTEKDIESKL